MGFSLSLLLFFLLVRYVLPRVLRVVLSGFVRQQVRKSQAGYGPFAGFTPPAGPPPAPGQVRVDYVPPQTKPERKPEFRGGEYVDYEEV